MIFCMYFGDIRDTKNCFGYKQDIWALKNVVSITGNARYDEYLE